VATLTQAHQEQHQQEQAQATTTTTTTTTTSSLRNTNGCVQVGKTDVRRQEGGVRCFHYSEKVEFFYDDAPLNQRNILLRADRQVHLNCVYESACSGSTVLNAKTEADPSVVMHLLLGARDSPATQQTTTAITHFWCSAIVTLQRWLCRWNCYPHCFRT